MIIECVPNISHGRNIYAMQIIHSTLSNIKGIKLLDWHWDFDHGRSVLTFIGTVEGIKNAVLYLTEGGIRLLNIDDHEGVHPYLGIIDVVPFIPVLDSNMEDCKSLANSLGSEIAQKFNIPVYLYGFAATRPDRLKLSNIRGHGFHVMKQKIKENPPDFGPSEVHPTAGVVVMGARNFLVAYNINLKTDDIRIGIEISKKVREKDGGIKGLQALAFYIKSNDCVQISMNITNPLELTTEQVKSRVKEEAENRGIDILSDELVGLTPDIVIEKAKKFKEEIINENKIT